MIVCVLHNPLATGVVSFSTADFLFLFYNTEIPVLDQPHYCSTGSVCMCPQGSSSSPFVFSFLPSRLINRDALSKISPKGFGCYV